MAKRFAISTAQKLAIRHKKRDNPTWTQQQLGQWFEEEFGQPIRQSSVSDALSNRYVHLSEHTASDRKKFRNARFPDLEEALYGWYLEQSGVQAVSGDALMSEGQRIWNAMPQAAESEGPKFSNGWLSGFKKRYGIQQRSRASAGAEGGSELMSGTPTLTPLQVRHLQRGGQSEQHQHGQQGQQHQQLMRTPSPPTDPALDLTTDGGLDEDIPQVSAAEALKLIARLQLHELQARNCDHDFLRRLQEHRKVVQKRRQLEAAGAKSSPHQLQLHNSQHQHQVGGNGIASVLG